MSKINRDYATAAPTSIVDDIKGPAFTLEVVRVIRTHERFPLSLEPGARSIGTDIDSAIAHALQMGEELLDIAVHFERSDWTALAESFDKQYRS